MNTKNIISSLICLCVVMLGNVTLKAQTAIDGANIGFMATTPPNYDGWTARTGTYSGYGSVNMPPYTWTATHNNPSTATLSGGYGSSETVYAFEINTNTSEYDANSNNGLKKIPTDLGFTRSVRLGNISLGGDCSELSYRLKINDTNCLLTFCYAMVLTAPHPGDHFANPTFEVDIVNLSDNLVKECLFFQNCGDVNVSNNLPAGWHKGATTGSWGDQWIYLDWQQITVNLSEFLNETVKLRIRVSGCAYSAHAGYGYFTAKVGASTISLSGCAGEGETVTSAEAPIGFKKYEWFPITYGTTDQYDIEAQYSEDAVVSEERIFEVTNINMESEDKKTFAVRLTSPTQHVAWATNPAAACVTYIPANVHDMRPKFDDMQLHKYIPVDPESAEDNIGFLFEDVQARNIDYPLDWQKFDFGDGYSLELIKNKATNLWTVDETATPMGANKVKIVYNPTTNNPDTIFHTYNTGNYIFTRYAHSYPIDPADTLECTKSDTLHINVPVRPTLLLTGPDTVCFGDKLTVVATSPGDNAATYTYEWWHGDDDVNAVDPFYTGTNCEITSLEEDVVFHVKVTTEEGFYRWGWDTVIVQAIPDIHIEGDTMICIGEKLHLTATNLNEGTLGIKWAYQRPTQNTTVGETPLPAVLEDAVTQDTVVYVIAETTNHCISSKSKQIVVVIPKVVADKKEICVGDEVILTGSGAVDYSWASTPTDASLQEGEKGLNPVKVSPRETTEYTMTGYGQNNCEATTNITITVVPDPIVNFGFSPSFVDVEEPSVKFVDSSMYSAKSEWTFSDGGSAEGGSVIHQFSTLNVNTVSVHLVTSNRLGCSQEGDTTLPVKLFSVWVPNAFSPDGDGINDRFFFITANDLDDVILEVYDRWGTKVWSYTNPHYQYESNDDINKYGWDGTYKDKFVQNGTYVWRFSYRRPGNTRVYDLQGTITSVR